MNRKLRGNSHHRGSRKPFHKNRRDFASNKNYVHQKNVNKVHFNNSRDECETISRLKETDVGITEYISDHEGFNGIIKQRYADFHVNEIDCDGNIVILTSIAPPVTKVAPPDEKLELEEHLKSVVSSEVFEKIKVLVEQTEEGSNNVEIEVTEMIKDDRRKLHKAIKAVGGGQLVSNTKEKEEKKFIVVSKHNSKARSERSPWPTEYGGDYVHFILHKENLDTMETVNLIASRLRIKPNMITYAGTKDRRAMTSQMMSIFRIEPKRLLGVSSELRGVTLGNFCFKSKGLKLGDLKGNSFRIVLRNVTGSDEQIEKAMTSLSKRGFLNYYGLQRFGTSVAVPTHAIGKALLQGDWKLAIELILKPREGEQNQALVKARKIWWETRDANRALRELPNREKLIEGKLLLGLSQCGSNDYVNALEKIPRNTRLLYLHSYQSLVWNKVVSRRVRELGVEPIDGDLVFLNDDQRDVETDVLEEEGNETTEPAVDTGKKSVVKIITKDDIESGHNYEIVMPLPGHDVVYPQNIMKHWYEDVLKEDGLSSASLKQTVRKYSVSGTYRKIVIRPDNLKWKTVHYFEPFKTLELSDSEKMKNIEAPKDEPDGTYKALVLNFCLPSSTYATMALREILKSDTSSQHQASLNNYHIQRGSGSNFSKDSSEENVPKPSSDSSTKSMEATRNEQNNVSNENSDMQIATISDDNNMVEKVKPIQADSCIEDKKNTENNAQDVEGDNKNDENINRKRGIDNADVDVEEKKIRLQANSAE